jgi:hypothetical protein
MSADPIQPHHFQPLNVDPLQQRVVPLRRECLTSLPISSTATTTPFQVFSPSITVLDAFEPETIHPAHLEAIRRANTGNAISVASINPSPTMFSRKKSSPHRLNRKGITGDKNDIASRDGDVHLLQLPWFVSEVLPPYQQHQNARLLLKPLTTYNYFYRDERDNIVHNFTKADDPLPPPQ